MIIEGNKIFKCEVCEEGLMTYDALLTYEFYEEEYIYSLPELDDIDKEIDAHLLVFKCNVCGATEKLNYRSIYNKIKKYIVDSVKNNIKMELTKKDLSFSRPYLIYCGKCEGFNGRGCCPPKIYKDCKIKRLPYGL